MKNNASLFRKNISPIKIADILLKTIKRSFLLSRFITYKECKAKRIKLFSIVALSFPFIGFDVLLFSILITFCEIEERPVLCEDFYDIKKL
jgi:hypothetical protein